MSILWKTKMFDCQLKIFIDNQKNSDCCLKN